MIAGVKINDRWFYESDDLNELRAAFPIYAWRVNERGKFEVDVPMPSGLLYPPLMSHDEIVMRGATKESIEATLRAVGQLPMTDAEIEAARRKA